MKLSKLLFFTFSFSTTTGQQLMEHPPNWVPGQTVITQSGLVHGKAASPSNQLSVYLGIPYALPPVGDLRFAPPQPYHGRTPIDGTKFVYLHPSYPKFSLPWSILKTDITRAPLAQ
jgi:cholinesterase